MTARFTDRPRLSRFRRDAGFTLLELVVTVVAVGVLSTLAVVGAVAMMDHNRDSSARQYVQEIVSAETRASVDTGQYVYLASLVDKHGLSEAARKNALVLTDSIGSCFIASRTSDTGEVFFATDRDVDPRSLSEATAADGVNAGAGCGDFTYADITPPNTAADSELAFGSTTLPDGYVGSSYQGALTASGAGVVFDLEADADFPPGLMLQAGTGTIAGTPTTAGTYTFGVLIADGEKSLGPVDHTIVIHAQLDTPRFYDDVVRSTATTTRPFSLDIAIPEARATTYRIASDTVLPAGMTLSADGRITGPAPLPATIRDWDTLEREVRIVATNPAGSDEITLALTLLDRTLETQLQISAGEKITIPFGSAETDVTIHWGDGTQEEFLGAGTATHTYAVAATRTVQVSGNAPELTAGTASTSWDRSALKITRWGELGTTKAPQLAAATKLTAIAEIPKDMTNLNDMFIGAASFNVPIGHWGTENVTSIDRMFLGATAFNQDLGNWKTSNITSMDSVFRDAVSYNQYMGTWDFANVTTFANMFNNAASYNGNMAGWKTGNVTTMEGMFSGAVSFNRDMSVNAATGAWDTSKVTSLKDTFKDAAIFTGDVVKWNTSSVTTLANTFSGATKFNRMVDAWDTSKVTDMSGTFQGASTFNMRLNGWQTGNVVTFEKLFYDAASFNQPVSYWDTKNATTMYMMFKNTAAYNQHMDYNPTSGAWNTGNVTDMAFMFDGAAKFNGQIGGWDTSKVQTLKLFLREAHAFNQPVGNWNISNVYTLQGAFSWTDVFNQDLSKWETSRVVDMAHLFYQARSFNSNISSWKTGNVTTMDATFSWATSFNQNLPYVASTGAWDTRKVTTLRHTFYNAHVFNGNVSNWDTSNVTIMMSTFTDARVFNKALSAWKTSKVTDMEAMFAAAAAFNQDITGWNTANVTTMRSMFNGATVFNRNISIWNVGKVTDYANFRYLTALNPSYVPAFK